MKNINLTLLAKKIKEIILEISNLLFYIRLKKKSKFSLLLISMIFIFSCTENEKKEKEDKKEKTETKSSAKDHKEEKEDEHGEHKEAEEKDEHEGDEEKVAALITVSTIKPKLENDNLFIEAQGKVLAKKNSTITSLSEGVIKKINFSIGDNIKAGEIIAILDNKESDNEIEILNNKLKINLNTIKNLDDKLKSYSEMLKIGIVAKNDVDNIKNEINNKKSENEDIKLNISKLSIRKGNNEIKANINGYISDILSDGAFVNKGQSIATIISEKDEYIEALVPAENIKSIYNNQKVKIIASTNTKAINAFVNNISPVASFNMIKVILKADQVLPLNLDVKIQIPSKALSGLSIPKTSVVLNEGKTSVFIVKDGKAVAKEIEIQKDFDNKVIVSKGISSNDQIIVKNADVLADGTKVIVK
ncbi:MAG: efflux RND transporter periplasmic adaptor subunit [Candidatus Sericytochromatia bacterium]